MDTDKINDSLYCGKWEEYMEYLEEAFEWLNKRAWCDPPESRFHKTLYWTRRYELFNVLTAMQELSSKLIVAHEEAKEEFEGFGLTVCAAFNIEERLHRLCHEDRVRSLREKYKTPDFLKKHAAEQPPVIKEIDLAHESDENRLMYAQALIQGMDTEYMLDTLIRCMNQIRDLMWDYSSERPNIETIRRMLKNLAPDWKFTNEFEKATLDYIAKEKPLTFQARDLTLEEVLHIMQQMLEQHIVAACQHTKWGKSFRIYLHDSSLDIAELASELYHADGCKRFLEHVAMMQRCKTAIEEKKQEIEEHKQNVQPKQHAAKPASQQKPPIFETERAQAYWERLREAGFVDEQHQLREGLSKNDAAYIGLKFNEILRPDSKMIKWQYFEQLWNISHLRSAGCTKGEYPKITKEIDEIFASS